MRDKFLKEVQDFFKNIKKSNYFLSPKDKEILLKLYENKASTEEIKNFIKQEIKKYPVSRRKKLPLFFILKNYQNKNISKKSSLKKSPVKNNKSFIHTHWEYILKKLSVPEDLYSDIDFSDELSLLELKDRVINFIWKNMSDQEKEKLKKEAVLQIKKMKLTSNVDKKEVLKSMIKKLVKEKYNIPD